MTDQTPIERAAEALKKRYPATESVRLADARIVFASIDTNELADVITEARYRSGTYSSLDLSRAVKMWLTGKEQRESRGA